MECPDGKPCKRGDTFLRRDCETMSWQGFCGGNIWLGGLCGSGYLYGARAVLLAEENPLTSLLAGHITLHVYNAPPVPAQLIDFILEYDVSYMETALTA